MKHIIVGVYGAANHGKTALLKSLTQSKSERRSDDQNLLSTVDISYTSFRLPDGTFIELMDNPGNDQNIHSLIAGSFGIDLALLVIAADEGVKPQTLAHLDILALLGIKVGVIALTKCDLVDKCQMDIIEADVRKCLAGRDLEGLPYIRVSAKSGKGIEALKKYLMQAVSRVEGRNPNLPSRLSIDVIQNKSEFRSDITGVIHTGTIRIGDMMQLMPQNFTCRVALINHHDKKVQEAQAGSRITVSLSTDDILDIKSASFLTAPGVCSAVSAFVGKIDILNEHPQFKNDESVLITIGYAEIPGQIRFIKELGKGSLNKPLYILFKSNSRFACATKDRFIIRSAVSLKVIGGGEALEVDSDILQKSDAEIGKHLSDIEIGSPEQTLETLLLNSPIGFSINDLEVKTGMSVESLNAALKILISDSKVQLMPFERYITPSALDALITRVRYILQNYHQKFPNRNGMPKAELQKAFGTFPDSDTLDSMLSSRSIQHHFLFSGSAVRLAEFQAELNPRQLNLMNKVEEVYKFCGIFIPSIEAVCNELNIPRDAVLSILQVGSEKSRFVRLTAEEYYHVETIERIKGLVSEFIHMHDSITVGDFRDLTDSNRKFAMQALEYLDKIEYTRREGDRRVLLSNIPHI